MTNIMNPTPMTDPRVLDVAKGVLIGARRCTVGQAFAELHARAGEHGVGVFALSRALVALGERSEAVAEVEAAMAARASWGELFVDLPEVQSAASKEAAKAGHDNCPT